MYEAYFQLARRPFSATPDANCFFPAEGVRRVVDDLARAARSGQGIGVLIGPAGSGKTLVCRRLTEELHGGLTPLFLATSGFATRRELWQAIHFELGRRWGAADEQELRQELVASLRGLIQSGRGAVLIVDEAHSLSERLLEELRILTTEVEGDEPLLRIVLAGQMPLELRLLEPGLEAFAQRIASQQALEPLSRQESRDYVDYRIRAAGGETGRLFAEDALALVAESAGGLPRCLNQLCDHSLLLACVHESPLVNVATVRDALADLKQLPLPWNDTAASLSPFEPSHGDEILTESEDEIFVQTEPSEDGWPTDIGATIAYEVGGESVADASASTTPSLDGLTVLPAPGQRIFLEERVEDRYAALDSRWVSPWRTFDDAPRTPDWQLLPAATTPAGPSAVVPPTIVAVSPDPASLDSVSPTISARASSGEPSEALRTDSAEVEEEIGENVLDVCLDLQASLAQWWDAKPVEPGSGTGDPPQRSHSWDRAPDTRYDVVEPERDEPPFAAEPADELLEELAPGRRARRPDYRHVFSALRRKAGRAARAVH